MGRAAQAAPAAKSNMAKGAKARRFEDDIFLPTPFRYTATYRQLGRTNRRGIHPHSCARSRAPLPAWKLHFHPVRIEAMGLAVACTRTFPWRVCRTGSRLPVQNMAWFPPGLRPGVVDLPAGKALHHAPGHGEGLVDFRDSRGILLAPGSASSSGFSFSPASRDSPSIQRKAIWAVAASRSPPPISEWQPRNQTSRMSCLPIPARSGPESRVAAPLRSESSLPQVVALNQARRSSIARAWRTVSTMGLWRRWGARSGQMPP